MNHEDDVDDKLTWLNGAVTWVQAIVDGARVALRLFSTGTAEPAAVGLIRSGVQDLRQWLAVNPCTEALLADQFEVIAGRYGFIVLTIEMDLDGDNQAHLEASIDRLTALAAHTTEFLDEMGEYIHGR